MNKTLKVVHIVALSLFLGSIFSHILLGQLAESVSGIVVFSSLYHAKYMETLLLTSSGLLLMLITGAAMLVERKLKPFKLRWLSVKLVIVIMISVNGFFILTPIGKELDDFAASAVSLDLIDPHFWQLKKEETIYGVVNLLLILVTIAISISKPRFFRG
jgi:hypothetical protein